MNSATTSNKSVEKPRVYWQIFQLLGKKMHRKDKLFPQHFLEIYSQSSSCHPQRLIIPHNQHPKISLALIDFTVMGKASNFIF